MFIHCYPQNRCPLMPPTGRGSKVETRCRPDVPPGCGTRQEHQLPLSTCHVRPGPWTTWSVTEPDRTAAPRP